MTHNNTNKIVSYDADANEIISLHKTLKKNYKLNDDIYVHDSVKYGIAPYFRVKFGNTGYCLSIVYQSTNNGSCYETCLFKNGVMKCDEKLGYNMCCWNVQTDFIQYIDSLYAQIVYRKSSILKKF
jgi:hypothetical protein